jgi:hypothetical protein
LHTGQDCLVGNFRRGLVAFGDAVVVEFAFGLDAAGAVYGMGVSAFGHHRAAIAV